MTPPVVIRDLAGHRLDVRPSGDLDLSSVTGLKEALGEACGCGLDVVVDLLDVEFVDAFTLGVFVVATSQRLVAGGGPLSVVGACPQVRLVFQLTGLDDLLQAPGGHLSLG